MLGLKESTIKSYKTSLNLARKLGVNYNLDQSIIINKLESLRKIYKINTLKNILNVVIITKKESKSEYTELIKYRSKLNEIQKETLSDSNEKLIAKGDILNFINNFTEYLYLNGKYKEYIINKLLIMFSVRNQDLFLTVQYSKETEENKNYLIINDDHILYIRGFYKTHNTYGTKKHKITQKEFINSCIKFLNEEKSKNLLNSKFENISAEIINCTYEKLGEGAYFKTFVSKAKSINEIKQYCDNRGTSFDTVYDYYNLNKF